MVGLVFQGISFPPFTNRVTDCQRRWRRTGEGSSGELDWSAVSDSASLREETINCQETDRKLTASWRGRRGGSSALSPKSEREESCEYGINY